MKGLFKGLATTLSTAIRGPVTVSYPDERHGLSVRQRSFPVLLWDFDHDEPACTGCNICVRNCPVDCMTAIMQDNPKYPEGTSDRRKIVEKFWIDYARCMRCNICVEVCPFEAIVMDNTWAGHEHAVYDRRVLHRDIDDLTRPSREGLLSQPWRPQDSVAANEVAASGEGEVEPTFVVSRPDARERQHRRIADGQPAAIQEREPEKPKEATPAQAAGDSGEEEILPPRKARARRMRAEREIKALEEKGEPVPAELTARIARLKAMEEGGEVPPAGSGAPAAAGGTGEALTGTLDDGSMRFPPGVGTGPRGDDNSPQKVRARRMRAERQAKKALEAGEQIPEEVAKILYDLGSDLAPGRTIWQDLAGQAGGAGGAPGAEAAPADAEKSGAWVPPEGTGTGPKGDANSFQKVRARRMRAERRVKKALEAGEAPDPEDIAAIKELGGNLPEGVS
ncbi:MAG: 4Fe-4S binding protein [Dehalococcoidia bacterium]